MAQVFKISPSGTLATLHSFDGADGALPYAGLVQARDGNFYGTTYQGGAHNNCDNGCGTVFKITPAGTLTTLHSFNGADGALPYGGLVQAPDGFFYGTTSEGWTDGFGTVFPPEERLVPAQHAGRELGDETCDASRSNAAVWQDHRSASSTSLSQSGRFNTSRGLGPSAAPTMPSRSIKSIRWAARP